ncbi:hypothetical protein E3E31_10335 [Thermococcus sp. M39]|uniref:DUF257 family protein n=1 Tax=unclassified Thermococcus TaxID=2627626 RepID=UPI00143BED37|nr:MULTISPECIES: DUF257 family protein [unclassified Thermococcus]NJE08913.1 hypothetical protein [Thermococcus sp. M39]NJE12813.1 hypothetical protein [Thermococcus sp. LS2]
MYGMNIEDVWSSLKHGEIVLIKYPSNATPYLELYNLVQWAKNKNYQVVVDDILDTLYVYKTHLTLAGFDLNLLNDVLVIKEGGRLDIENAVGRTGIKESAIQQSNYEKIARQIFEKSDKFIINIVLGLEKIFILTDTKREILNAINNILSQMGNRNKLTFYFINLSVIESLESGVLPLLEELTSTIIKIKKTGKEKRLLVIKSMSSTLDGLEIPL